MRKSPTLIAMVLLVATIARVNVYAQSGSGPCDRACLEGFVERYLDAAIAHDPNFLGVTSLEKSPLFPDLPTIASQGVPGYEYQLWWGTFAPAGMSPERLKFINAEINKIIASPDMKKFLDTQGAEAWPLALAPVADLLPKEIARYKKAIQVAGIEPQ